MIDPAIHASLHRRWLNWWSENGPAVDASALPWLQIRREAAEACARGDGSNPLVAGIRREAVDGPLWRGIALWPEHDRLGLLKLRVQDRINLFPTSFSKSADTALRFATMFPSEKTMPVVLKITSARYDHMVNGVDLAEYNPRSIDREVISGGVFVCTACDQVPGVPGVPENKTLGLLTLCQLKVF